DVALAGRAPIGGSAALALLLVELVGKLAQLGVDDVGRRAAGRIIRQSPDSAVLGVACTFQASTLRLPAMSRDGVHVLQLVEDVIDLLRQVALAGGQLELEEDGRPTPAIEVSVTAVANRAGETLGPASSGLSFLSVWVWLCAVLAMHCLLA